MEDRATFQTMAMNDGTEIKMTLSFGRLYRLRQKDKEAYGRYNRVMMDGAKDEFDFVTLLHTGHLCAELDNPDGCMDLEEFIGKLPDDHMRIVVAANRLKIGDREKKRDLGARS